MRNILDNNYTLVQNLLAYVEDELRTQPEKTQLAELCRIAADALSSEVNVDPQSGAEPCKTFVDIRFSISGSGQPVSCKFE